MELIDKRELIRRISELPDLRTMSTATIGKIIKECTIKDAVPVVHAKWIYGITLRHEWRKCSKCLVSQEIFGCFTYCPNCGARMDGDPHDSGQ